MKQDNWLLCKSYLRTLLTYNSTATRNMLISAPIGLKPRQMSFGMEPIISSPFPLSIGQVPTMTHYLAHTLSYSSETYSSRYSIHVLVISVPY